MYNLPVDDFTHISWGNTEFTFTESLFDDLFNRVQQHIGLNFFSKKYPHECHIRKCAKSPNHFYENSYEIRLHKKSKIFVSLYFEDCNDSFKIGAGNKNPVAYPEDPHQYLYYVFIYHLSNIILEQSTSKIHIISLISSYDKICTTNEDIKDYFFELSEFGSYTNIKDFIIHPYGEAKKKKFPFCWLIS